MGILQDRFLRHNAVFFIGSLIVAVLNYAFHPILSRMLSVAEFGDVQALISVTYIIGILSLAYRTVLVAHADENGSSGYGLFSHLAPGSLARFAQSFLVVSIVLGSVLLALSPMLAQNLQLGEGAAFYFMPLVLAQIIGVALHFYSAHLQGMKDFLGVSVVNAVMASVKLIAAVVLVAMGLSVLGVMLSFVIASVVALGYAGARYMRRTLGASDDASKVGTKEASQETTRHTATYYRHGWLVLVSLGFVTFFYTSDVIVMKYFFAPEDAGLYSGVATIARVIFFATASVAGVVLASVGTGITHEKNLTILRKGMMVVCSLCAIALGFFALMPKLLIALLIGTQYAQASYLLLPTGAYVALCAILNLLYTYFLALGDRRIVWPSLFGLFVLCLLVGIFHDTQIQIVWSYLASALMTVCATLFLTRK